LGKRSNVPYCQGEIMLLPKLTALAFCFCSLKGISPLDRDPGCYPLLVDQCPKLFCFSQIPFSPDVLLEPRTCSGLRAGSPGVLLALECGWYGIRAILSKTNPALSRCFSGAEDTFLSSCRLSRCSSGAGVWVVWYSGHSKRNATSSRLWALRCRRCSEVWHLRRDSWRSNS